jgi:phosphatidylinositol glycan class T
MFRFITISLIFPLIFCYKESLKVDTLGFPGQLQAQFKFLHSKKLSSLDSYSTYFGTFPRAIERIFQTYNISEIFLTFGQQRWEYEEWGKPPHTSAPMGVTLEVEFEEKAYIRTEWQHLVQNLSGLTCASLNLLDMSQVFDKYNEGGVSGESKRKIAMVPKEAVCTENLTPWVKLLPCGSKVVEFFFIFILLGRIRTAIESKSHIQFSIQHDAA